MESQNRIVGTFTSDQREGSMINGRDINEIFSGVPSGTYVELVLRWER